MADLKESIVDGDLRVNGDIRAGKVFNSLLSGGLKGQILSKKSNENWDLEWISKTKTITTKNTNLADYIDSGEYDFSYENRPQNSPTNTGGFLEVYSNGTNVKQFWYGQNTTDIYIRNGIISQDAINYTEWEHLQKTMRTQQVKVANSDLNYYITEGRFSFKGAYTPTNIPYGLNGWLEVYTSDDEDNYIKQIWYTKGTLDSDDYYMFVRTGKGSGVSVTWSNWRRLVVDTDISYLSDIIGYDSNNLFIGKTGTIYLRPNGKNSSSGQVSIDAVGKTTINGEMSVNSGISFTSSFAHITWKEWGYGDKFRITPNFNGTDDDNKLQIQGTVGDAGTDPTDFTTLATISGKSGNVWIKGNTTIGGKINGFNVKCITEATDFNSLTDTGIYGIKYSTFTGDHRPRSAWGTLFSFNTDFTGTAFQMYVPDGSTGTIYKRSSSLDTWVQLPRRICCFNWNDKYWSFYNWNNNNKLSNFIYGK